MERGYSIARNASKRGSILSHPANQKLRRILHPCQPILPFFSFAFASDPKIVGGKMMEIPLEKRLIPLLEIETIYECNKVQFLCNSKGIFFFHAIHEIGCCCRVIGRSSGTSVIIGIHSASEVGKNVDLLITERHGRPQSVNYIAVRMVNRAHVRAHWPKPTKIFVAV